MERQGGGGISFDSLPERCIANVISFTSSPDACRISLVSPTFRSAAESDTVWKKFLPSNYVSLVSKSEDSSYLLSLPSKKELFFRLCNNPILIDGETKSFWLDKRSGKKCYMLAARDLMIAWGSTPKYWSWISLPDSRFKEVAQLKLGWWLKIRGKIDTSLLSPSTMYVAYLVFKWGEVAGRFELTPTEVSVVITGSTRNASTVSLAPEHNLRRRRRVCCSGSGGRKYRGPMSGLKRPSQRQDGWLEIELGEYFNGSGEEGEVLEMSITEVKSGKTGLIVQGIEIRSK